MVDAPLTLEYAQVEGFRPLLLDLHLPSARQPGAGLPVVVYVHGGGWRRGTRRMTGPAFDGGPGLFARITGEGFAVVSADYRLSGEALFPAQLDDVRAALAWVGEHAAEFGMDAGRVVLWGESAGAHLAALLALSVPGVRGVGVRGVVDWYGPANLLSLPEQLGGAAAGAGAADSREGLLLGGRPEDLPEPARAASPRYQVHADAPPFRILHGTADRLVPFAQSRELADALDEAGVQVELTPVEGADHMWTGASAAAVEDVLAESLAFARAVTA